jgi:hypothetical protein
MSNRRRTKIHMSATYADLYRRSRSPLLPQQGSFERHLLASQRATSLRLFEIVPRALNGIGTLDFAPAGLNWIFEFPAH